MSELEGGDAMAWRGLPWVPIATGIWRHPKFAGVTALEAALFVALLGYCYEQGSDGVLEVETRQLLRALPTFSARIDARERALSRLEARGAVRVEPHKFEIVGFLENNPQIERQRARSRAARVAARARWDANAMRSHDPSDAIAMPSREEQSRDTHARANASPQRTPAADRKRPPASDLGAVDPYAATEEETAILEALIGAAPSPPDAPRHPRLGQVADDCRVCHGTRETWSEDVAGWVPCTVCSYRHRI
jgi:hypothetical protein